MTAHQLSAAAAAFLGAFVEAVEALTVVLAVGAARGWGSALAGAGAAFAVLAGLVALLGVDVPIPARPLQLVVGMLTLLFGLRWLRKAVLRAAGIIPLRDEEEAFAQASLQFGRGGRQAGWDRVASAACFQIVMLEGIEVVFIVAAVGAASGLLAPASGGAVLAVALVVMLGFLLHRPLARMPENTMKFAVGVMMCGFGTVWAGEGVGIAWPGGDWVILANASVWACAALLLTAAGRVRAA